MDGFFVCKLIKYDNTPVPVPVGLPSSQTSAAVDGDASIDVMDVSATTTTITGEQPIEETAEANQASKNKKNKKKKNPKQQQKKDQ